MRYKIISVAGSMDRYSSGIYKYIDSCIGWIVTDGNIYDMYQRTEMEEDSRKTQVVADGMIAAEVDI